MSKHRAYLSDRLYVPKEAIRKPHNLERFLEKRFYEEAACAKCELLPYRHSDDCDVCPSFKDHLVLWREKIKNGREYIALPPSNLEEQKKQLGLENLDVKIKSKYLPFDHNDIKFTGKLYEGETVHGVKTVNQKRLVRKWLNSTKRGILKASAGSGKTVCITYIVCKLKVKTTIVVDQIEVARQIYHTFVGSEDRAPQTSLSEMSEEEQRRRIRLIEKPKDFKDIDEVDIVIVNYQKFIHSKEKFKWFKKHLAQRTLAVVDESHSLNATAYSQIIGAFSSFYRLPVTATDLRKDGRNLVLRYFMGPVLAESKVSSYIPEIHLCETKVASKYKHQSWIGAMKYLFYHDKRNKKLVRNIKRDMKEGHKSIIVPIDHLKHARELEALFKMKFGEKSCRIFANIPERDKNLQDFDDQKFPILIAVRKMIRQAIDLKNPSSMHLVVPMSASKEKGVGAPMFYQLTHRIARRAPNKPQPKVTLYVDQIPISLGCFKGLFWKEIFPKSTMKQKKGRALYVLPPETMTLASKLSNQTATNLKSQDGKLVTAKKIMF